MLDPAASKDHGVEGSVMSNEAEVACCARVSDGAAQTLMHKMMIGNALWRKRKPAENPIFRGHFELLRRNKLRS
jgi:hypothetical protein